MFEIVITAGLLILILWVLFSRHKTTERNAKALNMSVFSIKSIDDFIDESGLLDVFKKMHLKGWNRFLYGDPYVALEKVVQNGKAGYYVAIPKKYEELLIENIHVKKTDDDILPKDKKYSAVHLHKGQPLVRFGESKLHESEGMALQVLVRHTHDGQGRFESNVRIIGWADSKDRSAGILGLKNGWNRESRKTVFDFFSRIFENDRRIRLSFGDLKDFLINKFVY